MRGSKTTWAVGSPLSVAQADCLAERGNVRRGKDCDSSARLREFIRQIAEKKGQGKFGQQAAVVGN